MNVSYNKIISNGNRTEWSPIRSVIIRVINKIGRPRSGSPICLITSMITDLIAHSPYLHFSDLCESLTWLKRVLVASFITAVPLAVLVSFSGF